MTSSPPDDDATTPYSRDEFATCLRVLEAVRQLDDGYHPDLIALEEASAHLRKSAKKKRRLHRRQDKRAHDRAIIAQAATFSERHPDGGQPEREPGLVDGELRGRQICYVCGQAYRRVHTHYHLICPECAAQQVARRQARADLSGRRALITGGRIKIGYACALSMLRWGARVLVTTRFPEDAARRFAAEPDADAWAERLSIEALDLRDVRAVLAFCEAQRREPLDILINNAALTVRRPLAYYRELAFAELRALEAPAPDALVASRPGPGLAQFYDSCTLDDAQQQYFPLGALDIEGKPLDLRPVTSWRTTLGELEPGEMAEVYLVSALAPAILNSQLRPAMAAAAAPDRYIVNVSAVEGQFAYANKTPHHPHTNMAKAALNMMTRTAGSDYAQVGIYMTSVDTGWITDENAEPTRQMLRERGFAPPLDVIDGAARVLDPIVRGVRDGEYLSGVFLKDYRVCAW